MKKVFIGLLIIAAAAGTYYFLQQKKTSITAGSEKDWLVGKWKMDSLYVSPKDSALNFILTLVPKDSGLLNCQLDFRKDGLILQTADDPAKADTSYYEWSGTNELLFKDSAKGNIAEVFSINKISIDSLILRSKDSALFVLTKIK